MPHSIYKGFRLFMRGQTYALCDSMIYDPESGDYVPTDCGPHGEVFYITDVNRFLAGGKVVD